MKPALLGIHKETLETLRACTTLVTDGMRLDYSSRVPDDPSSPDPGGAANPGAAPRGQPSKARGSKTLDRLKKEAAREFKSQQRATRKRRRPPPTWGSIGRAAAAFAASAFVLGALPFFALIRGAVYLHAQRGVSTWLALGAGVLVTVAIVTAYGVRLAGKVRGGPPIRLVAVRFALPLVAFYAAYCLLYLSSTHFKSPEHRAYYRAIHPLLRVALATVVLFDRDVVITDVARKPEDYTRMGLPVNHGSLHLPQRDGYVRAVDLRTTGRGWIRNTLAVVYFRVMGFGTLRHVGTADHLHVSLPSQR